MTDLFTPHYSNNDTILNSFSGSSTAFSITTKRYELSAVYNSSSTVFNYWSGQIDNFIYGIRYFNTPSAFSKMVRKNYRTGAEDLISCPARYGEVLDYIVMTSTKGLLLVNSGAYLVPSGDIYIYELDWGALTYTLKNTYTYSYSATYYLNKLIGTCRVGDNIKLAFYFVNKPGSYLQGDIVTYDYDLNSFTLINGPTTSYNYTYSSDDSFDRYADMGGGYMGFLLDASKYICVLDTNTGTLYANELLSNIHSPLQVGDYKYITTNEYGNLKNCNVAPNYTDNSFYVQCIYQEVISGTSWSYFISVMKITKAGVLSIVKILGNDGYYYSYIQPMSLSASKDRIISCYYYYAEDISATVLLENNMYHDITNNVALFNIPYTYMSVSPSLDDTDDNLVWVRETPENDFSNQYIDSGSSLLWSSNADNLYYENGWDWASWTGGYPATAYISSGSYSGMYLTANSEARSFLPTTLLWSDSVVATSTTGIDVNITSGSDSYRMVTVTDYFIDNNTIPTYSTGFNMRISGSDWMAVYPGWGATSWGGDSAMYEGGNLFNMDLSGTVVVAPSGNLHVARAFISGSYALMVNQGDRLDWSADNEGDLNFEVYDVDPHFMELGWGIQINRIARTGTVIATSIYVTIDADYIKHPMFARLYYSDGTRVENSISLPVSSGLVTTSFTIPANKNLLFLQKIVIGRYIDKFSLTASLPDKYRIEMLVKSITLVLSNSSSVYKAGLSGSEIELYNLGADGYADGYSDNIRIVGETVNYKNNSENSFYIHYLTSALSQFTNVIMW